jgi:ABC-2 type transport system ATP-binding protein
MKALSIKNLHKIYPGVKAVDGVDFEVEEGDFFGFLGPNGAGKTTTLNCVIGLAKFSKGKIEIFGKDNKKEFKDARRLVGIAPQEYNFDPYLNIQDVLVYQAGYYGISKSKIMPRVKMLLKQFNLDGKKEVDFRKLSGGMKRRLTLARALVHKPRLLILDEPTAGVDVELRLEIHKYLAEINKRGVTILLTSHYIDEIEKLCNKTCIINNGKIIANDLTKNLVDDLDTGHTEILTDKKSKVKKMDCVEFKGNKIIVWNKGKSKLKEVFDHLSKQKINVLDIKSVKDSLQDIFLRLTKR